MVLPQGDTTGGYDESDTRPRRRKVSVRSWVYAGLAVVVVTASLLRFAGITHVGIRFDDEGAYVGDARLWHRCVRVLTDGPSIAAAMRGDKATLKKRMDDIGVDFSARYAKPSQGYTFLGAAAMFAVGDRPAALLVMNAASGVLAVIVLYALGAALFGRGVGLCAAMFLAVSPYHLSYCRSAFADATAGLFVLLGLWIFIIGVKRNWLPRRIYGWSGMLLGLAITCHYRYLYLPAVLMIVDVFMSRRREPNAENGTNLLRLMIRRWTWLAAGVAVPAVCIELLFQAARAAAWLSDSFFPVDTYFQAWWNWIGQVLTASGPDANPVSPLRSALAYYGYFVHWHGIAAIFLVVFGVVLIVRKPGLGKIPALVVLLTVVLLVCQPYGVARAMSVAVPCLCLCAAIAVFRLPELLRLRIRWYAAVVGVLLLLFLVPAFKRSSELCRRRSDIAGACAFVAAQGGEGVAVPIDTYYRSKYWLYLEKSDLNLVNGKFHRLGSPQDVVALLRRDGVRWFITDPQEWHYRHALSKGSNKVFRWWQAMDEYLDREAALAAEFPHISDNCWEFLAEGPGVAYLDEMIRGGAGTLRVYDLATSAPSTGRTSLISPSTVGRFAMETPSLVGSNSRNDAGD